LDVEVRDPNFEVHDRGANGAATLLRIANADILPYDYVEFARTMRRFERRLIRQLLTST
jgi:N-acetylated-alpha-linked acidic dipeptidase